VLWTLGKIVMEHLRSVFLGAIHIFMAGLSSRVMMGDGLRDRTVSHDAKGIKSQVHPVKCLWVQLC